ITAPTREALPAHRPKGMGHGDQDSASRRRNRRRHARCNPAAGAEAPLIAREKIFGNPTRAAGRLSPDGKWLSWIAPRDGVMNVRVAPASDPNAARALTAETKRPIRSYFWAPDSSQILYINDKGGDENFL